MVGALRGEGVGGGGGGDCPLIHFKCIQHVVYSGVGGARGGVLLSGACMGSIAVNAGASAAVLRLMLTHLPRSFTLGGSLA